MERTVELYERNLPHIVAYERPLFITFATRKRRVLPPPARTITLQRCVFGHPKFYWLHVAVVMPDHVHLVLTLYRQFENVPLRRVMKGMKGTAAREINRLFATTGHVWNEESYDRVVRRREGLAATIEYVIANPVRAELVRSLDEYPWVWRCWKEGAEEQRHGAQTGMSVLHGH